MIVFVNGKDKVAEAMSEYKKATFVRISDEIPTDKTSEGRQFLPPDDVLAVFIDNGDVEAYRVDYCRYLNDPRVKFMLLLQVYQSSTEHVFFVCTKSESELLYPKFLKDFIVNSLGVDKKFVVSYKKFDGKKKVWDKPLIKHFMKMITELRSKAKEAYSVLN